jgi:hypothetical protein
MTTLMQDFIATEDKQPQGNDENQIDHLPLLTLVNVSRLMKGGYRVDDRWILIGFREIFNSL